MDEVYRHNRDDSFIKEECKKTMSLLQKSVDLGDLGNFTIIVEKIKDVFGLVPYDNCYEPFFTFRKLKRLKIDVKGNLVEIEATPSIHSYISFGPLNLWKLYVLYFIYSRIDRNLICNNSEKLCRLFERVDAALSEDPPRIDDSSIDVVIKSVFKRDCKSLRTMYRNMLYVRHVAKKIEEALASLQ